MIQIKKYLSFDPLSFDPVSFDPLSFDLMSFDPVSFDPMSVNHISRLIYCSKLTEGFTKILKIHQAKKNFQKVFKAKTFNSGFVGHPGSPGRCSF